MYNSTSILPGQSNDIVVEYIERKAFSEGPFEIGLEEVVSPSIEIPSMIKLNAPQLGNPVRVFSGTESIVGGSCRDDKRTNPPSDELVVFAGDGIQDGRVEEIHWVVSRRKTKGIISCP